MNFRIVGAILRKDLAALYPLALLTALVFAGDVVILRWDLVPTWPEFRQLLLVVLGALATLAVFQLDSPVSLVDDWLCRPVPRKELLAAKLSFLFVVAYLPGMIATLIADLYLGAPVMEAAQDAVLLRDTYFPLVVPLLLLTAVVTRTLVQGIGVLIALLVCMLVIPGPFVKGPDPLNPGIGDGLAGAGLGWLALTPAKLLPLLLAALGFWLIYAHRRVLQARILLAITAGMTVFLFVLPMWLLPWSTVFAAQTTLNAVEASAGTGPIYLRPTRTCFPATRLGEISTNAAFNSARETSGLPPWNSEDLRDSGPESIAFLTAIEPRRVPTDWRVKLNYVQADYFAAASTPLFSLRPARYNTGLAHAWVLPASALLKLQGVDASLKLRYSLTLLRPHHFSLLTDGRLTCSSSASSRSDGRRQLGSLRCSSISRATCRATT